MPRKQDVGVGDGDWAGGVLGVPPWVVAGVPDGAPLVRPPAGVLGVPPLGAEPDGALVTG